MEKKTGKLTPEQDALEHILAFRDKSFLEERFIDPIKGRGLFTRKVIAPSTFVVEYRGVIISHKGAKPKRKNGDYLFEFSWRGVNWTIDASMDDGTFGRLVNDDHKNPNCEMKIIPCEGKPHLCLFSLKEILPEEEITYSYGDASYPWRAAFEDSEASTFENSDSDDDNEKLPDCENDSFANINHQLDFGNSSHSVLDSSQEIAGALMQPNETSFTQQEDEAASSSDEDSLDEDHGPSKASKKIKDPSCTSKNFCYVCGAGCSKIARHLLRHADEEPEIAKAFALPKKSNERKKLLLDLRNRGNYRHNQEVLKNNSGELKLQRRPTTFAVSAKTHMHCPYCKGMFKRKEMWRHVARCPSKKTSNSAKDGNRRILNEIALAESPFSQKIPSSVRKMLLNMKQDDITLTVFRDVLIIQLAQYLSKKYEYHQNKHDYIRHKLRLMGRLLIALRKKSVFSIKDAIKPKNFHKVVEAVKDLSGFDEKTKKYSKPSFASKLGHSLKQIGASVLAEADGNPQMKRGTEKFMKLCAKEWNALLSKKSYNLLSGQTVKKPSTIPFTRDVQVFYSYLETISASAIESLKKNDSLQVYNALCRVTLAKVSVLNKCTPEVSKMTLKTFKKRGDSTQVLSKHFFRINILSSTGQNVAVLLTPELVSAVTLLVSKREACGVHKANPFLFARPDSSSTSYYTGTYCMKAFSNLCRAKNPEHLRSGQLNKHIARVFQILNLENDELCHLAKLLGHVIRADKEYYRLPEAAVDLAKIAKLLRAMEKGSLEKFKGNSLEEIEIEDELEPDLEQDDPESNDSEVDNEESDLLLPQTDVVEQQAATKKQRGQLTPEQDAQEHIKSCRDKAFLEEKFINPIKGRGVFTRESIEASTFVVEYRGNISHIEATRNKSGDTLNHHLFDFSWNGTNWRIDASEEDGSLGRLVNDDHINPNCEIKKIVCDGTPHLCLFAMKKIVPGKEITYNYGDAHYPWRLKKSSEVLNKSQMELKAAAFSSMDEHVEDSANVSSSAESSSDDEYIPDGDASSDDSSNSIDQQHQQIKNDLDPDSSSLQGTEQQPFDASDAQQEDKAGDGSDDLSSHEKPKKIINKNYCYVCGKALRKVIRHLYIHRHTEPDIAKAFALPRNSKERGRLLVKLRNKGNYKHNQEVLKTNRGELKVRKRRSGIPVDTKTFALCIYCKNMYTRTVMQRHMANCSAKKSIIPQICSKTNVQTLVAAAESTYPEKISSGLSRLLERLKEDEIGSVIKNEPLILKLARCLWHINKGKTEKQQRAIVYRLRLMGRLLIKLRKKSVHSFEDAVKPSNFSKIVEVFKELSRFNEETKCYDRPSVAKYFGSTLKKLGTLNFAIALKEDADNQTIQQANSFLKLCEEELSVGPSSIGYLSTISFIQDVQLYYQYMEKVAVSATESLSMYEIPEVYNALLKVTSVQVMVFNKNMVDVSKVTVESFNKRNETEPHEDAAVCQSQFDQALSEHFVKINCVTDMGKQVVVMLTPKLLSAITLLLNKRDTCGVHQNNPFLFGKAAASCSTLDNSFRFYNTFITHCGASSTRNLKSVFFRGQIARFFHILSLTNDGLVQLAKLLGCDIRTDSDYYQTPEAAEDIAKISELLSAMEDGSFKRFEGKSLKEIPFADELVADRDLENPGKSHVKKDNEESESFLRLSDLFSAKGSVSKPKKNSQVIASSKRGRPRKRKQQENKEEFSDENNEVLSPDQDSGPEEMPVSHDVNTPEETPSRSNVDTSRISFSDYDEDMNVDFDIDSDGDIDRNEGKDESKNSAAMPFTPDEKDVTKQENDNSETKRTNSSPNSYTSAAYFEESMDMDEVSDVEREDQNEEEEQNGWMDVDSGSPSPVLNTEKKSKSSAAVAGIKEVKILIPKLKIGKLQAQVHVSPSTSTCKSVKLPVNNKLVHDDNDQCPTSSASTDASKPSDAKSVQMSCSHCKKSMMKGQTAYQKKGFMDVFCSKNCLFKLFPINKPVPKTCYYCHKAISQPLDLIMAAVDTEGTMEDFCSVTCLSSFKSNSRSSQTPGLDNFRRGNAAFCDNCSSTCTKPLKLKLEEETKMICNDECLDKFKEKDTTSHQCTMCHTSLLMSDMVHYKSDKGIVKLFCTRLCVTSYKLQLAIADKPQGRTSSGASKSKEDVNASDSTADEINASAAAKVNTQTLKIPKRCSVCRAKVPKEQILHQSSSSSDVFCSDACFFKSNPSNLVTKKCYNCFQVIERPHNIILAPVDDSGTMKELCSNTCLSSFNSKLNLASPPLAGRAACKMCSRFCFSKLRVIINGEIHRLCSDYCFIKYHKYHNLPVFTCDVCSSICHKKCLMLKLEEGSKNICSDECLVKFKEDIKTRRLCPMCQTSHQMSDMVENENDEGRLDFFCSNRCMMVHKAQSVAPSKNRPTPDENDIKEEKPSLPNIDIIKEEPIDEEYNKSLSSSITTDDIKDEPNVTKEDLQIDSVFSLTGDSKPPSPTLTHSDLTGSCSDCRKILTDGETVYQRKGHDDIFCSTSCLLKFYQMKQVKKTCHFCLQLLSQSQDVLQAPVDAQQTMKDFCSQTCLSSFNYKKIMSTRLPLAPVASQSQCSMCSRCCISEHEVTLNDVVHKICSDSCFLRFCNMNKLLICENCHCDCSTPIMLKMRDGRKRLCGAECLAQFKQQNKTPQPCTMCCTPLLMSEMVESKNSEEAVELFCTSSCVMVSKIQAVSASGILWICDYCAKSAVPACHLAMSDSSIRNFCTLTCAMAFKENRDATQQAAASDQTENTKLKAPQKLTCAQCERVLKTAPKVVQEEGKINFVCSLACCQKFRKVNNIMGKCEFCKNVKIICHIERVEDEDCYFCSDGCKMLFCHDLEEKWGKHCRSCAYCQSISKTVVMEKYKGVNKEFCSDDCNSKYKTLVSHLAKCDSCGREGKLKQTLCMLGEISHFCDLKCLLRFCNKKMQMVDAESSLPTSADSAKSSPVIANVISLAGALARQQSSSACSTRPVSVPDIQTKVVGHASVQTVSKEVKNKSMLCTPLVHNKGVSCTTQTVDTEAQTDDFVPKERVVPVPVPVYVPVPMNMYSQFTPEPVILPVPVPVPVFLPAMPHNSDPTTKSMKEKIQPDLSEEELDFSPQLKERRDERSKTKDRQKDAAVTKEGQEQDTHSSKDIQEDLNPAVEMREDSPSAPSPSPVQHNVGKVHKNEGRKMSKAAKKEKTQEDISKTSSKNRHKLRSQGGIDAWKRWIQWRKSQAKLGLISSRAVTSNEDVLDCSASELSAALCCFIKEVKRPDGEPYSPDSLFYLCLSIQQYLFENGRMENIFSDPIYDKFSVKFTKILRGFKPPETAGGFVLSRVEEEFLWECKQLGAYSPIVLLNTLLFFFCKHFGFHTVEQHHQLSFANIECRTRTNQDNTKTTFLRFNPPTPTNETESDADGVPAKKRKKDESKEKTLKMMENTKNPLRCPIRLYKFYLSKCSDSVRRRTDLFYLQPDGSCAPSSPLWFSSTPLDNRTMEAVLVRVLAVRELQGETRRAADQQTSEDAVYS